MATPWVVNKGKKVRPEGAIYILAISSLVNYPRFDLKSANTR